MMISPAYAQTTAQPMGDMFGLLMPMVLIFAIMYFLMIRPQQKRQKEHRAKLASVKRGDKVITGGGIVGTIRKVSDDGHLMVEIGKDTQIEVVGSTLMDVLVKGESATGGKSSDKKKSSTKRTGAKKSAGKTDDKSAEEADQTSSVEVESENDQKNENETENALETATGNNDESQAKENKS